MGIEDIDASKVKNKEAKEALETLQAMTPERREQVIRFVFEVVKADLKIGLDGEDAGIFFDEISNIFEKAHLPCYFSGAIDGNETPFTEENAYVCEICRVKLNNILEYLNSSQGEKKLLH